MDFNTRRESGKIAARNMQAELKHIADQSKPKIVFNIDIVAHSMGFAYAQGFIEELKKGLMKDHIKWKGFYIIAPENGCSGSVNPDDWEQVWQYGTQEIGTPIYDQDGVAPQCAVGNIDWDPSKGGRAYIPATYSAPRQIKKLRISPSPNPALPLKVESYLEKETKVPVGFLNSHSIGHYGWIFEISSTDPQGFVNPR